MSIIIIGSIHRDDQAKLTWDAG